MMRFIPALGGGDGGGGEAASLPVLDDVISGLSPTSWWKLTENSGNYADSGTGAVTATALGNTVRVTGGPGSSRGGAVKSLDTTGIFNAGDVYDFAGVLPFTAMVLWFPIARSTYAGQQRVFAKEGAWIVGENGTDGFFNAVRVGGASLAGPNKVKLYEWNMCALSYSGSVLRLFANGYTATVADVGNITGNANPLLLGQEGGGSANWSPRAGTKFSNPAIWNRALSLDELTSIWDAVR
jgi:hypothetical protein